VKRWLGDAYRALGRMTLALRYYYEVLPTVGPEERYDFLLQLARWEGERDNRDAARRRLEEAIRQDPKRPEAYLLLAHLLAQEGRYQEAYHALGQGVRGGRPVLLTLGNYSLLMHLLDAEAYALQKALGEEALAFRLGEREKSAWRSGLEALLQRVRQLVQVAQRLRPPEGRRETFLRRRLAYALLEQAVAEYLQSVDRRDDVALERAAFLMQQMEAELTAVHREEVLSVETASARAANSS
jgi:tetratricopeptide (TPR) repeat protein